MDGIYSQGDSQIIKIINGQVGSQLVENNYYTSHATFDRKSVQLQKIKQFKGAHVEHMQTKQHIQRQKQVEFIYSFKHLLPHNTNLKNITFTTSVITIKETMPFSPGGWMWSRGCSRPSPTDDLNMVPSPALWEKKL